MFAPTVGVVYRLEKGRGCGKCCAWVGYLFGKGGAMWASPPTIPPALRATSLFKGGFRANGVRPYGVTVLVWERGRGDVGGEPYGWVSGLWRVAYRETIIPRRGEQAAAAAVRKTFFLR